MVDFIFNNLFIAVVLILFTTSLYFIYLNFHGRFSRRKNLASQLSFNYEFKNKNKESNIITGNYKGKKIKIYDKFSFTNLLSRYTIPLYGVYVEIDGKIILRPKQFSLSPFNRYPSSEKIKTIVDDYIDTGKIKKDKTSDIVFYIYMIFGITFILSIVILMFYLKYNPL
ncbi:hypothetical protein KKA15_01870 [Patescibacteria group bacterium]|nr:hypothetical protein [Patescibacteria group bacterium]